MKPTISVVIGLSLLFLVGCVSPSPKPVTFTPPSQELKIVLEIEGAEGECETKDEWKDELTNLTFVSGGEAYMSLWSSLTSGDSRSVWKDIQVLHSATDVRIINLFLNSPGGSAFSGLSMADHFQGAIDRGFTVRIYASGLVASAAVPIFAVGSERYATPGTVFMVHEASLWKWPGRETASDIRSQGKLLDLIRNRYLEIMALHTNLTVEEWGKMEGDTTWFDATTAKKWGLVDYIN